MSDTKELRTAYIAVSEGDKTPLNKQVKIKIIGTSPIIAGTIIDRLTGPNGADYGLMEELTTTTPAEADNKNVLFDKNTGKENRYVFLGKAKSLISNFMIDFYYDEDFQDIIAIPELAGLGIDTNNNFYINDSRTIIGYSVGYGESMNDRPNDDITLTLVPGNKDGIAKPNRFTQTKTILAPLFGLEKNSLFTGNAKKQTLLNNFSKRGAPLQMVVFDANSTLFAGNQKIHTYNLLQQFHAELKIDYVGKQSIEKIVLIINF